MHTMPISFPIRDVQYGYPGPSFEDVRQLIEPSHLASGEPSGPGGDVILCLLEGESPREVSGELAHPHRLHDLGADPRSGRCQVSESLGFTETIPGNPPRPLVDCRVDGGPLGAQIDDGGIVTEVTLPDRTPGFGPGQLQFLRPGGPARVRLVGGYLLRPLA